MRARLGVAVDAPLLIHLGSIGCNVLLGEMLDFFAAYRERHPAARMLYLAPDADQAILAAAHERGLDGDVRVHAASREEVPHWLGAADLGLFFVRPVFSKKAASPTKLGEMLAVGLPVVTNSGVGDVDQIIADLGAGVVVSSFDSAAYEQAVETVSNLKIDPRQLREHARRWFDIRHGIEKYDGIYRRMISRKASTSRGACEASE
jgi:glycosyltransferase involved in cell wall biosynthesis